MIARLSAAVRWAAVTSLLAIGSVTAPHLAAAASDDCLQQSTNAESLNAAFDAGLGNIVGADYQRAFELDDGRVLWVFQDAFIDDGAGEPTLVHNAGAIQDGMCFTSLAGGTQTRPTSWIAPEHTNRFRHWYWPLDGYEQDADMFVLYLAEMEEHGSAYLRNATPLATVSVEIDLNTMTAGKLGGAPNSTTDLYGFEVTTDDEYRYLYGQCHRQFGFAYLGHDECANLVYVARQPLEQPNVPLEYWDGNDWTRNSRAAANIAPLHAPDGEQRGANPMQIERDGDRWIAVTKAADWWGNFVYFDVAPRPEGPWTTTAVLPVANQGDPGEFSSYFVSFIPTSNEGRTIAISNNRWDGRFSDEYHPTFTPVRPYVWFPRHAQMITDDLWLPLGKPVNATTTQKPKA
jgi:hypothetical protein